MTSLSELADNDPAARAQLNDLSISNRELARALNVNESSIRRYRRRKLQNPGSISSPSPKYKQGVAQWIPGLDLGQDDGEVRTIPRVVGDGIDEPEDADLMRELGVDPEQWEIIARRESRWQSREDGDFLKAYRISVRRRVSRAAVMSVEQMSEILAYYTQPPIEVTAKTDDVFVVPIGDLQVGKAMEARGGTPELIDRFGQMTEQVRARLEEEGGTRRLVLAWIGDLIEGVLSQGGKLVTRQDQSVTEQVRLVRRLAMHQIGVLAPYAEHVVVVAIPGNHDRTSNQYATSPDDSWAVEALSAVEDALTLSDAYSHVSFMYPKPETDVITLDVGSDDKPFVLAFAHGDQAGSSPDKVPAWWKNMSFGNRSAGRASLLFSAHWHHLQVRQLGARTWVMCPALDGGSEWWSRRVGDESPAGMISMIVTPNQGIGWRDLRIHTVDERPSVEGE